MVSLIVSILLATVVEASARPATVRTATLSRPESVVAPRPSFLSRPTAVLPDARPGIQYPSMHQPMARHPVPSISNIFDDETSRLSPSSVLTDIPESTEMTDWYYNPLFPAPKPSIPAPRSQQSPVEFQAPVPKWSRMWHNPSESEQQVNDISALREQVREQVAAARQTEAQRAEAAINVRKQAGNKLAMLSKVGQQRKFPLPRQSVRSAGPFNRNRNARGLVTAGSTNSFAETAPNDMRTFAWALCASGGVTFVMLGFYLSKGALTTGEGPLLTV